MSASEIVNKVWNYAHVLRDDGVGYGDYFEQITFLIFLKMADERLSSYNAQAGLSAFGTGKGASGTNVPEEFSWARLVKLDGDDLENQYRHTLENLGKQGGMLGTIFRKAQNKIQDPAKLERLIKMIDKEQWSTLPVDVKGEIYEGLLERNAQAGECPIISNDALAKEVGDDRVDMVLANPPFGKKSSITVINEKTGKKEQEKLVYERTDFWATTSNKQLNFVQHIANMLKIDGKAAVVVPDNVLFEGGAGETVRKNLLERTDLHTLLRLPTGIFYAQGVKANVIFFDAKPASKTAWTKKLWIYDFRTNVHMTLKTKRLVKSDFDEFIKLYCAGDRRKREATWSVEMDAGSRAGMTSEGRWRSFTYEEIIALNGDGGCYHQA